MSIEKTDVVDYDRHARNIQLNHRQGA